MLKDQKDLLSAFNAHGVDYLVVGGHAVNAYGVPRTTKDLDLFIRPEHPNSERVFAALSQFGAPLDGITEADFRDRPEQVFQVGVEPARIDILQDIGGIEFKNAWDNRVDAMVDVEVKASFIGFKDLILSKQNIGRARDLADIEELRATDRIRQSSELSAPTGGIQIVGPPK